MTEREQIVAWLRKQADDVIGAVCGSTKYDPSVAMPDVDLIENIARRIERGDHLPTPAPDRGR